MAEPARNFEPEEQPEKNFWQPEVIQGGGEGDGQPAGDLTPVDNIPSSQEDNPVDDFYKDRFDPTKSKSSDQDGQTDLGQRENNPDSQKAGGVGQDEKKGLSGGLYQPGSESEGGMSRVKAVAKGAMSGNRKFGWIGGGAAGLIIALMGTFMMTFSPIHILENFFNHNFDYNDSFGRNRTSKIIGTIFNMNKNPGFRLKDTPFKQKADLIDFMKFEERMKSKGWHLDYTTDAKGKIWATGLIDPQRNKVDISKMSKKELAKTIQPMIDDTIPAWRMNKRVRTRQLITTLSGPKSGFKWHSLLSKKAKEKIPDFGIRKFFAELGRDDIKATPDGKIVEQKYEKNSNGEYVPVLEDGKPVYEELGNGSAAEKGRIEVIKQKLAGASDAVALRLGTSKMVTGIRSGAGKAGSIILVGVVVGCIAYAVYEQDLIADFERYASAMRIGATFLVGTNEIKEGNVADAEEVGKFFMEYNDPNFQQPVFDEEGNPKLDKDGKQEYITEAKTFAASSAWQRATGDPAVGPELDPELHVIQDGDSAGMLQTVLGGVGSLVANIPGFGTICKILGSGLGMIVGYVLDAAETLVACIGGVGVGCAVAVGKWAAIEGIFYAIGRILAASLTSFVGFLIANPEQSANFLDQSLSLISSEEARTAKPVEDAEYNTAVAKYFSEKNQDASFGERYFALSNTRSFLSRLTTLKMDLFDRNPAQLIAGLFSFPTNSLIAATTSGNVYAQNEWVASFENYGIQKYSYDTPYMNSDPADLAEEVMDLIEADDNDLVNDEGDVKSGTDEHSELDRDFAVLCMGYNPNTGEVNKSFGTQMLPQFSDPQAIGEDAAKKKNELFSRLCIDEAIARADRYSKIGRYVNDLELVTSIVELSQEASN